MAPAPQGGGQSSDNSAGILWGVAALFAAIGIIWYAFKTYIVSLYLITKLYEVNLLSHIITSPFLGQLQGVIQRALLVPDKVTFNDILLIGGSVGSYLRIPILIIFLVLAVLVYFGNSTRVFKRAYNMKELAKLEQPNWPQITPVIGLNLIKEDIHKGPWAMAMTPMQFCKRYRLLAEVRSIRPQGMTRREKEKIEVVLLKGEANKLFTLQLGPLWKDIDHLPLHIKALFAVFAARINADSKGAEALLMQIAASSKGKLDFSGTNALLKKHANTKLVQKVIQSHAYVFTVMAAMLEAAREDGVQASADFLWLKPFDRKLWYTLNAVGRQTPFVEVAGIFAHWLSEKEAGRKLVVPIVEEATKALELALQEVVYRPDEEG